MANLPWPCSFCSTTMTLSCEHCRFPEFTPLGGTRMLARSLLEHYEIDSSQHPTIVAELDGIIGFELLSIGREILEEHGLLPDVTAAAAGSGDGRDA